MEVCVHWAFYTHLTRRKTKGKNSAWRVRKNNVKKEEKHPSRLRGTRDCTRAPSRQTTSHCCVVRGAVWSCEKAFTKQSKYVFMHSICFAESKQGSVLKNKFWNKIVFAFKPSHWNICKQNNKSLLIKKSIQNLHCSKKKNVLKAELQKCLLKRVFYLHQGKYFKILECELQ